MKRLGEHLEYHNLYVKEDNLSGESYGGNKLRKLEFTLAEAQARGARTVITVGAVGSNHVLATTLYAKKLGLKTVGIFVPQPMQKYLGPNILLNAHLGCAIEYVKKDEDVLPRVARVFAREWSRDRRRPYLLLPGGSSVNGVLGYVDGALEIAAQVRQGLLPEPDYIFCPVGSGGTLAGLLLGICLSGLKSTAIGVRVAEKPYANERVVALLANLTWRYLRRKDPTIPNGAVSSKNISLLHDFCGRGYAHYTRAGVEAITLARELEALKLEGTYSGKTLAAMLEFTRAKDKRDAISLFINTYNSAPLEPLLKDCPGPEILPPAVRAYFEKKIAPVEM